MGRRILILLLGLTLLVVPVAASAKDKHPGFAGPDPVVTWNTEAAARAFISSKGAESEFHAVQLTDEAMDRIARAMGHPVEAITFDPYPT